LATALVFAAGVLATNTQYVEADLWNIQSNPEKALKEISRLPAGVAFSRTSIPPLTFLKFSGISFENGFFTIRLFVTINIPFSSFA